MKQKFVYGVIAIIVAVSLFAIGWKASQISQNSAKMSSSSNEEQNGSFSGVQRDEWKSLVDFVPDANVDYKVSQFLKKYLVINACPQEFAPCRDLLFDLQSRKEIKMEFPSPMGKILISADEKYAAFIGMGSFSQPGVSIEVADGKKVYCLLSEDEVTDVEIRDGTISFREYSLGEPVGDKNAGMEKSFNIKDACQEKIYRGEGYEFSYPHSFSVSESDDQIVFSGRSSEFSISLLEGNLETEFFYPPSGEMIRLKEVPIGSQIWYEWLPGDGGGNPVREYKTQLKEKTLVVHFFQFRKGWSDGGDMDDTKYQNAIFGDMISQEAILSGFRFF